MICPKQAKIMWPQERMVYRNHRRYDMGPDEVVCIQESPSRATYVTPKRTPEGWTFRIVAKRDGWGIDEKVGQRYAIRWGFVD